jgi:hypothetical protein
MALISKVLTWASVNRDDPEEWAQLCCEGYIEAGRDIDSYLDAEDETLDRLAEAWIAAERALNPQISGAQLDR